MVDNRYGIWLGLLSFLAVPMALGKPEVTSVQLISASTVTIKPCQPVYALLRATFDGSSGDTTVHDIPGILAREMVVNERRYRGSMGDGNNVAGFEVDTQSRKRIDGAMESVEVLATMCGDIEKRDWLFVIPGRYDIEFYGGAKLVVTVEEPTPREKEIIERIRDAGVEYMLLTVGPGDRRTPEVLAKAEDIFAQYPDSVYAKSLSIALGITKLPEVSYASGLGPDEKLDRALAVARKYFEPYCSGAIESPAEAMAAYDFAGLLRSKARRVPDGAADETARLRREARALLEKVKESPYSLRYRQRAADALRELND